MTTPLTALLPPLATTSTLLISGIYLGASWLSIPALLSPHAYFPPTTANGTRFALSTSQLLATWRFLYLRGKDTFIPLNVTASVACAGAAYLLHPTYSPVASSSATSGGSGGGVLGHVWKQWALSGVLISLVLPFTIAVMGGTNDRLLALGNLAEGKAAREEVVGLLRAWNRFNVVRGLTSLAAGVVAVGALGGGW